MAIPTVTYLATLTPDRGQSRLTSLPRELRSEPGYENAIVIACPSNQARDRHSEVIYETRSRYDEFVAGLRPYHASVADVLVAVHVFSDPPDRLPGAPPAQEPRLFQARTGDHGGIAAPIDQAHYLRLRVECEKPDGFVIFTDAAVRRS